MYDQVVLAALRGDDPDQAWSLFLDRYRRLIFSVVRKHVTEYDDVMDLFAFICDGLRADNNARLRRYTDLVDPQATFPTWLVVVTRNLAIDWHRTRDGRSRPQVPATLSPVGRRIYERLVLQGYSQRETFELVLGELEVSPAGYREALREVYRTPGRAANVDLRRDDDTPLLVLVADSMADEVVVDDEAHRVLAEALRTLDVEVRVAIALFVIEGVAAADVARILGWANAKMVYNRVSRGLATLREFLESRGLERDDL